MDRYSRPRKLRWEEEAGAWGKNGALINGVVREKDMEYLSYGLPLELGGTGRGKEGMGQREIERLMIPRRKEHRKN